MFFPKEEVQDEVEESEEEEVEEKDELAELLKNLDLVKANFIFSLKLKNGFVVILHKKGRFIGHQRNFATIQSR